VGGNFENSGTIINKPVNRGDQHSRAGELERIDRIVAQLLAGIAGLPADHAATAAGAAVTVKEEMHAVSPDEGKVTGALSRLRGAVRAAAPVAELAAELAKLVTQLLH
jgi:hypothetical protein